MSPRQPGTAAARSASVTGRALVLLAAASLIPLGMSVPLRTWLAQRSEIASLEAEVLAARDRVASMEVDRERWQDPEFVSAEARRRLLFIRPGEIGYVAIDTTAPEVAEPMLEKGLDLTWYQRVWQGVLDADAGVADVPPEP